MSQDECCFHFYDRQISRQLRKCDMRGRDFIWQGQERIYINVRTGAGKDDISKDVDLMESRFTAMYMPESIMCAGTNWPRPGRSI